MGDANKDINYDRLPPGHEGVSMRDRTRNFRAKFQAAARELGCDSHREILSLKFREMTHSGDYPALLLALEPLKAEEVLEAQGDYQGHAWKLTDPKSNAIILVEHETGLEILYVAGAAASIVGLIPLVINAWKCLKGRLGRPPWREVMEPPEQRGFDDQDRLVEGPAPPIEMMLFRLLSDQYADLRERVSALEARMNARSPKRSRKPRAKR